MADQYSLGTIEGAVSFRLTRKIAEGGMGAVYEAQQIGTEGFEKTVAIKMLLRELAEPRFSDLFVAEAMLVARLVHENIVQIYQLGRTGDEYYIVMEYVQGISLADFIRRHRFYRIQLPEELAVYIASRVARGLAYAHKRKDATGTPLNIVHRDVCPNNILITTEGLPKLADFGVAKAANTAMLDDRFLVGKYLYMAPEQAQRQVVDYRADIFSLGAVLFELLTYRPIRTPDKNKNKSREDVERLIAEPVPWDIAERKMSQDLVAILKKMLGKRPEDRYQDTDVLARTLEYYIYRHGYGPTIQTLEAYLRKHFDYLYASEGQVSAWEPQMSTVEPWQSTAPFNTTKPAN
ncbi:MAG: serine/threonine protein kinase [Kiritimatiellae bacterium]|nr:serine/threonine protein kinase [Kiritimatiellia bacterium]